MRQHHIVFHCIHPLLLYGEQLYYELINTKEELQYAPTHGLQGCLFQTAAAGNTQCSQPAANLMQGAQPPFSLLTGCLSSVGPDILMFTSFHRIGKQGNQPNHIREWRSMQGVRSTNKHAKGVWKREESMDQAELSRLQPCREQSVRGSL